MAQGFVARGTKQTNCCVAYVVTHEKGTAMLPPFQVPLRSARTVHLYAALTYKHMKNALRVS